MRILLLAAGLAVVQTSDRDPLAANPGIPNYYRIRPDVAAAGQPSDEALADIQKAGFKTVINLRTEEEGSRVEAPKIEALGLEYHNIQWGSAGITREQFDQFEKILADSASRPVLIHCASSNRVGALWYLHQVLGEGKDEATALEEARKAGMKPNLETKAKEFVEKNRAQER
jgi:uncharacterized protein (TIGR01244 family)